MNKSRSLRKTSGFVHLAERTIDGVMVIPLNLAKMLVSAILGQLNGKRTWVSFILTADYCDSGDSPMTISQLQTMEIVSISDGYTQSPWFAFG